MGYGLDTTGFTIKRLETIKEEIEAALKSAFGEYINLLPESVFGQLVGIFSEREAELWELAESVYYSQYPNTAIGTQLDNVVSINGISRRAASKSIVRDVYLLGTATSVIPAGTQASVNGNGNAVFESANSVTLDAGQDEIQEVVFSGIPASGNFKLGYYDAETIELPYNAAASSVESAINDISYLGEVAVSGIIPLLTVLFSGKNGKQPHPLMTVEYNTTDKNISISRPVTGIEQGKCDFVALNTGRVLANAFTLTEIDTPVFGLDSIVNHNDAELGQDAETDAELRIRRNNSLQVAGAGTVEAIRSSLLSEVEEVTSVLVYENDSFIVVDGREPKSFECVVYGGDEDEIAEKIWEVKPAGIKTQGAIEKTVIDSQGFPHTIRFSRPTEIEIYIDMTITTNSEFPSGGLALVEQTLIDHINSLGGGVDVVIYPTLIAALNDIPGIIDIELDIGTTPSPSGDSNIPIAANEIAITDSTKVSVVIA